MRRSLVAGLVVGLEVAGACASLPTQAAPAHVARTGTHRLVAHRVVRRSRELTVRRVPRDLVTRDFDPVPLGGGPIANLARDVEEVYGHDLPLEPRPTARLWLLRDD